MSPHMSASGIAVTVGTSLKCGSRVASQFNEVSQTEALELNRDMSWPEVHIPSDNQPRSSFGLDQWLDRLQERWD